MKSFTVTIVTVGLNELKLNYPSVLSDVLPN